MKITLAKCASLLSLPVLDGDTMITSVAIDSRLVRPGGLFVAIQGGRVDGHDYIAQAAQQGAVAALVSQPCPDSPIPALQVVDVIEALGQLAAWWREQCANCRVIAITGSCGKSTTKDLTQQMLSHYGKTHSTQGNLNNELGMPLTLLALQADHDFAVLEMGAGKPGDLAYLSQMAAPDVAVITTIGYAHAGRMGGLEGVANTKAEIVEGLREHGILLVNADVALTQVAVQRWGGAVLGFGKDREADVRIASIPSVDPLCVELVVKNSLHVIQTALLGAFNAYNVAAAVSVALALDLDLSHVALALQDAQPTARRMSRMPGPNQSQIIDDAYNANPTAVQVAVDALLAMAAPKKILVMGDMLELGDASEAHHRAVGAYAKAAGVSQLYAIGPACVAMVESFGEGGEHYPSHEALVAALERHLDADTLVLVKGSNGMRMHQVIDALRVEST